MQCAGLEQSALGSLSLAEAHLEAAQKLKHKAQPQDEGQAADAQETVSQHAGRCTALLASCQLQLLEDGLAPSITQVRALPNKASGEILCQMRLEPFHLTLHPLFHRPWVCATEGPGLSTVRLLTSPQQICRHCRCHAPAVVEAQLQAPFRSEGAFSATIAKPLRCELPHEPRSPSAVARLPLVLRTRDSPFRTQMHMTILVYPEPYPCVQARCAWAAGHAAELEGDHEAALHHLRGCQEICAQYAQQPPFRAVRLHVIALHVSGAWSSRWLAQGGPLHSSTLMSGTEAADAMAWPLLTAMLSASPLRRVLDWRTEQQIAIS